MEIVAKTLCCCKDANFVKLFCLLGEHKIVGYGF